jgi:hypothetical protein
MIPASPSLETAVLEFTVDASGCPEGYVGLEKDICSAMKRIAMLAKCLGGNVHIERKFIIRNLEQGFLFGCGGSTWAGVHNLVPRSLKWSLNHESGTTWNISVTFGCRTQNPSFYFREFQSSRDDI